MTDEQEALSDLMLFNEMVETAYQPDYDKIPFWGYPADQQSSVIFDGKTWTISDYFKPGYCQPEQRRQRDAG